MLSLLGTGYGNRAPDWFGNTHVARDRRGLTLLRHPGDYQGRHRRPELAWPLPVIAPLIQWRC
jgi:hypothetical protein